MKAHDVTREFEKELALYTGARDAICVNSCTMAILLAVAYWVKFAREQLFLLDRRVAVPKRTYVGVPMSVLHAGAKVDFIDSDWQGAYQLYPTPVWDSARWLTSGLYKNLDDRTKGTSEHPLVCLSFHATKTLGIEQGGAILCDDVEAGAWLRRMRFDGRHEGVPVKDDDISEIGYHCYMNPSTAAQGLMRMPALGRHNAPLPWDDYPDLSLLRAFQP